ncbi:hypothetical protein A9Q84_10045 [Halobacteriovorax marinus]|uniref:Putative DNA-binding domain-containing protein n=1 Tax=Halobacteriovorax marinus TaxID=97084 RepID=A0A1Y5F7B5_9BACT|nr:hypothetical protein A9Q84_10045 [Halobacteriovorax marinus]
MKLKELQTMFLASAYKNSSIDELEKKFTPAGTLSASEAMEVYAEDYEVRMLEALKENYAKVYEYIGAEKFYLLYNDFKETHSSSSYDLERYGDDFPHFIKDHLISAKAPNLHTLAEMDKTFRAVFHAPFIEGLASQQLADANENSIFNFLDTLKAFDAPVPLWKGDYTEETSFFFFRTSVGVNYFPISKTQYTLFSHLLSGRALGEAIELTPEISAEEVQQLFLFFSSNRLIKSLK